MSAACSLLLSLGIVCANLAADEADHAVKATATPLVTDAVAILTPTKASDGKTAGTIVFKADKGLVMVTGEVTGLKPGKHGFHIHMYGDLR